MSRDDLLLRPPEAEGLSPSIDLERVTRQVRINLGLCTADEAQPVRVDRYTIIRRIGRGSFGEVFLAHDEKLPRQVALKLVRPDPEQPPARLVARVHREAQVLAAMSHPNIAHAYDVGEHEQGVFIVMEYIEGQSLEAWQTNHRGGWSEIVAVYLEAGRALEAAHDMNVIHKDFKPSNVLVGKKSPRRVCVIDWGLAQAADREPPAAARAGPGASTRPLPTQTMGFTPKYAAPEQMLGEPVSARADQFAFCVSLFEALFGEPPFVGSSLEELRERKCAGQVVPYARGRVPPRVEAAIRRGLSAWAGDRFADMGELLEALSPRRVPLPWVVGGALGVGIVVGYGLVKTTNEQCTSLRDHSEHNWNVATRSAIERAFEEHPVPYARDAADALSRDLDAYVGQWREEASDACRELEGAMTLSTEARAANQARLDCLDQRLAMVGRLLLQLQQPSLALVERAPMLVDELPTPADCRHGTALSTVASAEAITELTKGLGQVEALLATHDWAQALEAALVVQQLAYTHELDRYEIEADLAVGRAKVHTGDVSGGVRLIEQAGTRAEQLNDELLAWNAWFSLARDGSIGSTPSEELGVWLGKAESAANRLRDEHRIRLLRLEAVDAKLVGPEQQRQLLEETLEWAQDNDREDLARATAASLSTLLLASDPERATKVAELAVELAELQLGPQHPLTVGARVDLAQGHLQSCRPIEAEAALRPILDGLTSQPLPYHRELLLVRASISLQLDRLDEARSAVEQARSLGAAEARLEQLSGAIAFTEGQWVEAELHFQRAAELSAGAMPSAPLARASEAAALLHQGRIDEALSLAQQARMALEVPDERHASSVALALEVEGLARLVRGELDDAETRLQAARVSTTSCDPLARADVDYALGLLMLRRGDSNSRTWIDRAHATYEQLGAAGAMRREAIMRLLAPPGSNLGP